ncbi:MAG: DUF3332 family protein [Nitrospirae bacterium]|nr:DUF3332 family protein [Nitrospirota bacterium]
MKRGLSIAVAVLTLASVLLAGCFGKFTLVRGLYQFNKQVEDKFVRSLVFDVMVIVPVYGIAGLVDWAVLNVIEFWTGKNPVVIKITEINGETVVQTISRADDGDVLIRLDRSRDGRAVDAVTLRNDSETGQVTAERRIIPSGVREVLRVEEREDGVTIVRREGLGGAGVVATASEQEIGAISRRVTSLRERSAVALGGQGLRLQTAAADAS